MLKAKEKRQCNRLKVEELNSLVALLTQKDRDYESIETILNRLKLFKNMDKNMKQMLICNSTLKEISKSKVIYL